MPFLNVAPHKVFYTDTGGDKPVLIFSHGFFMDQTSFDLQYEAFGEDYRCIGWDEMGFGRSPASRNYSYWDSAEVLLALMDELGIARATLVGVSKGGFISLRVALMALERVKGIVLIGSESGVFSAEQHAEFSELVDAWGRSSNEELTEEMAAISELYLGDDPQKAAWIQRWSKRDRSQINHAGHALLNRDDVTDRLEEITCPALIIHGSDDQGVDYAKGQAMAAGLPRGEFFGIDQAPHGPNMTHPTLVNERMRAFLESENYQEDGPNRHPVYQSN
ncbi:MAG: alpha/beta hydrolase [Geminicoccus sp.]|nr:alpha/beta hydrolase [Geminicoccus sp.]